MKCAWVLVATLGFLAACRSTPAAQQDGQPGDVIRLSSGDVLEGRIVEETPSYVAIDIGDQVSVCPRSTIYNITYAKKAFQARSAGLPPAAAQPPAEPAAPSGWYPRARADEAVEQKEVLWFDKHLWTDCLGTTFTQEFSRIPEFMLFAPPGGKIVLHDPKCWGYHAHLLPQDSLQRPVEKPGLSIDLPSALPQTIVFISPSQEMTSQENEHRSSYAPPDACTVQIKPLSLAETLLAVQPFAGGRPAATAVGKLWAFSLPRNSFQFFVYLCDPEGKHGEILKQAFAAYGDTVLAADFMIDVQTPDGVTVGRILAVPFPDGLSADGPAPELVTVYAGPTEDPTLVASMPVPPRQTIQFPPRAPALKADLLVSHYDVSRDIGQTMILAYGTGRPTADVEVVSREITPAKPDEVVKIDLSSRPEEQFPAVVWFYQRRSFAWKETSGRLAAPALLPARAAAAPAKLARVKRSSPIPHVLPLVFQGPKSVQAAPGRMDPAAGVAGGMSNALIHDALARKPGSSSGPSGTSSLTPPATSGGGGESNVSSVTNVYITSPTHTPALDTGGTLSSSKAMAGWYMPNTGYIASNPSMHDSKFAPMNRWDVYDPNTGKLTERSTGRTLYDPNENRTATGTPSNPQTDGIGVDTFGRATINIKRRTAP